MATIELTDEQAREANLADDILATKSALELAAVAYAHAPTHLFTRAHDQLLRCAEAFGKARDAFEASNTTPGTAS